MKIADAAARLGVATHVLRHWEDVGVLHPRRSASGHREYAEEEVAIAGLVQVCQRAGLSLAEIAALHDADAAARVALVAAKRVEIAGAQAALARADAFLAHLLECRHPVVMQCPECLAFSQSSPGGPESLAG